MLHIYWLPTVRTNFTRTAAIRHPTAVTDPSAICHGNSSFF